MIGQPASRVIHEPDAPVDACCAALVLVQTAVADSRDGVRRGSSQFLDKTLTRVTSRSSLPRCLWYGLAHTLNRRLFSCSLARLVLALLLLYLSLSCPLLSWSSLQPLSVPHHVSTAATTSSVTGPLFLFLFYFLCSVFGLRRPTNSQAWRHNQQNRARRPSMTLVRITSLPHTSPSRSLTNHHV